MDIKQIMQLDQIQIEVGFWDKDVAEYALYNEFGTEKIPQRSFLRSTLAENRQNIVANFAFNFRQTGNAKAAAALTSTYIENLIKAKIASGNFAPNAPATVKKKGSKTPLIDSGRMLNSVKGVVKVAE